MCFESIATTSEFSLRSTERYDWESSRRTISFSTRSYPRIGPPSRMDLLEEESTKSSKLPRRQRFELVLTLEISISEFSPSLAIFLICFSGDTLMNPQSSELRNCSIPCESAPMDWTFKVSQSRVQMAPVSPEMREL